MYLLIFLYDTRFYFFVTGVCSGVLFVNVIRMFSEPNTNST